MVAKKRIVGRGPRIENLKQFINKNKKQIVGALVASFVSGALAGKASRPKNEGVAYFRPATKGMTFVKRPTVDISEIMKGEGVRKRKVGRPKKRPKKK